MGMKTIFSNRLYKHKIDLDFVTSMDHTLRVFNQAKHFRYQAEARELRGVKAKSSVSIHQQLKQRYGLNDYYATSAVQQGRALLSAQKELKKVYMRNKKEQINAVKRKIKATKARLTTLQKIKDSFVKGTPTFNKTSREQQKGAFFVVRYKRYTRLFYCAYDFEHQHLDVEIKHLKSRLGQLNFKKDRYEKQLIGLSNKVVGVCFGSKKLARGRLTQKTYHAHPERWQKDWAAARYGKMTVSGRKDAKSGNFVFHYHPDTHTLTFKAINQCVIRLADVVFSYGQNHVNCAIQTQMKYMKRLGVSIHMAAAYVIARRAMGFKEKLPPMLYSFVPEQKQGLHHWAQWAYMTRTLSFVRTHAFYQTERFNQSKLCSWNTLFPQQALTDAEKIGLRRLESRKTYA